MECDLYVIMKTVRLDTPMGIHARAPAASLKHARALLRLAGRQKDDRKTIERRQEDHRKRQKGERLRRMAGRSRW
jgi:hypothetical protein